MFSVLWISGDTVEQLGPFKTEEEANAAARAAQDEGTFDITDTNVYLLDPNHLMTNYSMAELGVS